jgi:effector-binding domain-containing protein
MNSSGVKIIQLEPMRVATALGFGTTPEILAWNKIIEYAKSNNYLGNLKSHRFFGFNNPSPSPGSPNYGYEQWITVGPEAQAGHDVTILDFAGGTYAVARCEGIENIGVAWHNLVAWQEDSQYLKPPNYFQCLEEVLNPAVFITPDGQFNDSEDAYQQVVFDLYLPVKA